MATKAKINVDKYLDSIGMHLGEDGDYFVVAKDDVSITFAEYPTYNNGGIKVEPVKVFIVTVREATLEVK